MATRWRSAAPRSRPRAWAPATGSPIRDSDSFAVQQAMVQAGLTQPWALGGGRAAKRDFDPGARPSTSGDLRRGGGRARARSRRTSSPAVAVAPAAGSPIVNRRRASTPNPYGGGSSVQRLVNVGQGYQRVGNFAASPSPCPADGGGGGDDRPSTAAPAVRRRPAVAATERPVTRACGRRKPPAAAEEREPTEVYAWGWNADGQCGVDSGDSSVGQPRAVAMPAELAGLAASPFHCLANTAQGDVLAWGSNDHGQLGVPAAERKPDRWRVPRPVAALAARRVWRVAAGHAHSVAVTHAGEVLTWGSAADGRLGRPAGGPEAEHCAPVALQGQLVVDVACGRAHTVALTSSGRVWSWGQSSSGQLGRAGPGDAPLEVQTPAVVVGVAAGDNHTLLLLAREGRVLACGSGQHGRLGVVSATRSTAVVAAPMEVEGLEGVALVAAGGATSFAVTDDGRLFAWGYNHYGQLGVGDTANRATPTLVESFGDSGVPVRAASAGADHAMAVSTTGNVYVWGRVLHGRLGVSADEVGTDVQTTPYLLELFARRGTRVSHVRAAGSTSVAAVLRRPSRQLRVCLTDAAQSIAYGRGLQRTREGRRILADRDDASAPVAGVWQHFTVQARDADGKNRTQGGDAWAVEVVRLGVKKAAAAVVDVCDNGDGTYSGKFLPGEPGAFRVSVALHRMRQTERGSVVVGPAAAAAVEGSPFAVHVRAGPADAAASELSGDGLRSARAGEESRVVVTARFADGSAKTTGGDAFRGRLEPADGDRGRDALQTVACVARDLSNGTYALEYEPERVGPHTLHVEVRSTDADGAPRWLPVSGSPFAVDVRAGPCCAAQCRVTLPQAPVTVGDSAAFTVHAHDALGNACDRGGASFYAQVTSGSASVVASVRDVGDGTYRGVYEPAVPGEHLVAVMLREGDAPPVLTHLPGSPFTVAVDPRPQELSPAACTVVGEALDECAVAGRPCTLRVELRDADGAPLVCPPPPVTGVLSCAGATVAPARDLQVSVCAPEPGVHTLTLRLPQGALRPVRLRVVDAAVLQFHRTRSLPAAARVTPAFYFTFDADLFSGARVSLSSESVGGVVESAVGLASTASPSVAQARVAALVVCSATGGSSVVSPTLEFSPVAVSDQVRVVRTLLFKMACDELGLQASIDATLGVGYVGGESVSL